MCYTGSSAWEPCAAKLNQMFHTQRLVEISLIGLYPFVTFIFLLTHMVNIPLCAGDFNKHSKHKWIASRDLRVALKWNHNRMKKINSSTHQSGCDWAFGILMHNETARYSSNHLIVIILRTISIAERFSISGDNVSTKHTNKQIYFLYLENKICSPGHLCSMIVLHYIAVLSHK